MSTLRRVLLGSALIVMASGIASADSIMGSCSSVSGSTELGPVLNVNGVNTLGSISCTQYNLNPAWLQSITLTISGNVAGSITLTNNDTASNMGSGTTQSTFSLDASLSGFTFPSSLFTTSFTTGTQTVAGNSSQTYGPFTSPTGMAGATDSNSGTFSAYEGGGNFSFVVDTLTFTGGSGGGGHIGTQPVGTTGSASATVLYTYAIPSTTPEPTTMVLLGSALVGIGILRKRVRS